VLPSCTHLTAIVYTPQCSLDHSAPLTVLLCCCAALLHTQLPPLAQRQQMAEWQGRDQLYTSWSKERAMLLQRFGSEVVPCVCAPVCILCAVCIHVCVHECCSELFYIFLCGVNAKLHSLCCAVNSFRRPKTIVLVRHMFFYVHMILVKNVNACIGAPCWVTSDSSH
jgi:hypothetical protein